MTVKLSRREFATGMAGFGLQSKDRKEDLPATTN
jgi:hypothetical protein